MNEDHPRRSTSEPANSALPRRLRGWLGAAGDPPLPRPRSPRLEPIRRSALLAFCQARISVRAGVLLDDWLRSRLASYLGGLAVPRARLPLTVEVDDGALVVRQVEPERRGPPASDAEAWLAPLVELEGPTVRQEAAELEIRLSVLEGELDAARKRTEELSRRLAADVSAGLVAAPPGVEATAEQMGRPPVPSAWPQVALGGVVLAAVAAETWQVALPLLGVAGLDPRQLGAELLARPAEAVFALLFALGLAAGLFALCAAASAAAVAVYQGGADAARRRWLAAAGGGSALLAVAVAAALAGLRGPSPAMPAWTYVLLLIAVPLAIALVARAARAAAVARAARLDAALEWDRERARALADRARRLDELGWAEAEEHTLERHREVARRRLRELSARAIAAQAAAAESERRERAALARLAQSLVSALELDRYEFVRQASARGATELFAQRRRKPLEPRAVEAPAAPLAGPVVAVEAAGRLAS